MSGKETAEMEPPRRTVVVAEPEFCLACGFCAEACPNSVIHVIDVAAIDAARCRGCAQCIAACPRGVLEKESRAAAAARAAGRLPGS